MGIAIRQLNYGSFKIVDVPIIEARIPLGTDTYRFKYGGHLMFGVTKFYVEWLYTAGIHVYPFGEFLSFSASGLLGTFFLDNITIMGAVATNFNIPFQENKYVTIGIEYFYRNSRDLLNFVTFPKFGDENKESINISSPGFGISIGVRF